MADLAKTKIELGKSAPLTDEEKILAARIKAKRRGKKRDSGKDADLNINSMMDMMFIILVFLIKSVGEEPIPIKENDDLRLPYSSTELNPEDMMTMTVTKQTIMVLDQGIIPLEDGILDPQHLQSAESAIIPELQQQIEETLEERQQWAEFSGEEFQAVVTIIADSQTPYRTLTQVMITSAAAGIENFKFAVLKRGE